MTTVMCTIALSIALMFAFSLRRYRHALAHPDGRNR